MLFCSYGLKQWFMIEPGSILLNQNSEKKLERILERFQLS